MSKPERVKIIVRGAVQGVGFRPFVFRLATDLHLQGWILNSNQGVVIEAEGSSGTLRQFLYRLEKDKPPRAVIQSLESSFLDPIGYGEFVIRESEESGSKTALVLPDLATCADCLREIFDPGDRRFRYPFTNCTNCGPRFSIIESLPYDRANTSMKNFVMCANCAREYQDPLDRRFHAQPNACPKCGPQLQLWDSLGKIVFEKDQALGHAADEIRAGKILALKGLGGFQLMVDARNDEAVLRLRQRKQREEKPFALMYPSLEVTRHECIVSDLEERLLLSPESPIVLLSARHPRPSAVAPGNPNRGAMLPYTPLHHLLMRELNFPIVATSGNLSDEPICLDERDALTRLAGIADFFLVHDRPIGRPIDDSVARIMCERESIIRRARGYAPLPVTVRKVARPTLALGGHLKNTIALGVDENIFLSQHIGDLETEPAYQAFVAVASDLPRLFDVSPEIIAHDLHSDYLSTKHAQNLPGEKIAVQHHWAHIAACMAENEIGPPVLGVAWDGTGLGTDNTVWGGEFFSVTESGFERVAHLRTFPLPGGEAAAKEPRRSALGLLFEVFQQTDFEHFSSVENSILASMLEKRINTPRTSSAGRLFDGVAALLQLRMRNTFEGEAAMALEFALRSGVEEAYPFDLLDGSPMIVDWAPMIQAIMEDLKRDQSTDMIAAKFHNTLVECIVAVATRIGSRKVVLSGGCFQNRYLTERTIDRLRQNDLQPYWHQRIPPNDGGISLGQIVAANWLQRSRT